MKCAGVRFIRVAAFLPGLGKIGDQRAFGQPRRCGARRAREGCHQSANQIPARFVAASIMKSRP
jgi:hypothetical protein